ncbi:hypothetical protein [Streptomyces sp. NPDC101455]|uniref:hypothetical protein n=1 Tax=Streptomyces sp. NPDC101455 TaxID=3366142 RepID=UPI00380B7C93
MTTTTTRPGLAAAVDPWLAKKLMEAGFGGPDCDFPDCSNARAPRPEGKPGPPPKFCVQHNNRRDRQLAYRARKALEKERAAAPEPVPVQQAVARGAREEQVLETLLPRVLTALDAVHQGQQAGANTKAVADHITKVENAADERVHQAEERREEAVRDAEQASEEAARSEEASAEARAEQQAAQMEAATALREAADADARATADRAALDELSETHRKLRDTHHELTGAHQQLQDRYGEQETTLNQLTDEHNQLLEAHGRLRGEKEAQDTRLEELTGDKVRLEEEQRRTAVELAATQSENTGLTARLDELQTHREELKAENRRLTVGLENEREQHRREVQTLRDQLDEARATARRPDGLSGNEPAPGAEDGQAPTGARDGSVTDDDSAQDSDGTESAFPAAIVDLGRHGGSGWSLMRKDPAWHTWTVLRDGETAGSIQPEHSLLGNSLLGWSARTSYAIPLSPYKEKYFPNREQAAGAVILDGLRRAASAAPVAVAAAFAALDEPTQDAVVAAVIPLATATPERGGRLAQLPRGVREAALRTALRVPSDQDLAQLTALDAQALGRSKEARQLLRALQDLRQAEALEETGPVDLGTIGGRTWRLEPDPAYLGGYRVLADGTEVGAIEPVHRRKEGRTRWTAIHRRRSLGRGPSHSDRDAAARAVIAAEDAWVPLPPLDDDAYWLIPAGVRSSLYVAANRIDLRRGRIAQIQPGAYRQQLHAALGQARRTAAGRIRGQHLAVLLDAAREDLGAPGSSAAQRLYEAIQEIRDAVVSGMISGP